MIKPSTAMYALLNSQFMIKKADQIIRERRILKTWQIDAFRWGALVQGTAQYPYEVLIDFGNQGEDLLSSCSCPVHNRCKHAAALLLHLLRDQSVPSSAPRKIATGPRIISLECEATQQPSSFPIRRLVESFDDKLPERGIFRAGKFAFVPALDLSTPDCDEIEPTWLAAMQYIKKDGSLGRLTAFRPEGIAKPPPPAMRGMFAELRYAHAEERPPLSKHLARLLALPRVPTAAYVDRRYQPLRLARLTAIEISGALRELAGSEARFQPQFRFHAEGVKNPLLPVNVSVIACGGTVSCILMEASDGLTLLVSPETRLHRILRAILQSRPGLTPADWVALRGMIRWQKLAMVTMLPLPKQIRIESKKPDAILNLESVSRRTEAAFSLRYGTELIGQLASSANLISITPSAKDELLLAERDRTLEQTLFRKAVQILSPAITREYVYTPPDQEPPLVLKTDISETLRKFGPQLMDAGISMAVRKRLVAGMARISFRMTPSGEDWFDVQAGIEGDDSADPLEIEPGDPLARKKDGRYYFLTKEDLELLRTVDEYGTRKSGVWKISRYQLAAFERIRGRIANEREPAFAETAKSLNGLRGFSKVKKASTPKGFHGKLRPYQQAGLAWLRFLRHYRLNGCLADDMGLGKTVQALALLAGVNQEEPKAKFLIVAPVSTLANWEREIERFTPGLSYLRHSGAGRDSTGHRLRKANILLVSYQTLLRDITLFRKHEFSFVILDESQIVKNPFTKASRCIRELRAKHRLALSGTPVENSTVELWSLMDFLNPGLLGNQAEFRRRFAMPIEKHRDEKAAERLRTMIRPFLLRRRKEEVATDLPEKEEITLWTEMAADQREVYEQIRRIYRNRVSNSLRTIGVERSSFLVLEGMLKLRQACLFPGLVDPRWEKSSSCKAEAFIELLEDAAEEGHKTLIFSQFVETLARIRPLLEARRIAYAYLDGSTTATRRQKEIDSFQSNAGIAAFLISLKAGGLGVNLTAADYVVLFDPWWNPAVESQAVDRAHRIGQTRKVIAYRLIVKDSIEEKIRSLQEKKRKLAEAIVAAEAGYFKQLTRDDILALFE